MTSTDSTRKALTTFATKGDEQRTAPMPISRKALVVGIDYYDKLSQLHGCVNDARNVCEVLARHADQGPTMKGGPNFQVQEMRGTGPNQSVSRKDLRNAVRALFDDNHEIALFYFAGHGYVESTGGYLCASDTEDGNDGLALHDVLDLANKSRSQNKIVILDSCHSGVAAQNSFAPGVSELGEGLTILTASTKEQYASEAQGSGVFTTLFVDAMKGAAANLVGDITPGSVYAHIDQSLGPWQQRPIFKTNVQRFVSLRTVQPPLDLPELRRLTEFFPAPGFEFRLDPSFEPEREPLAPNTVPPNPSNTQTFAILQKLNRVNLLVPVDAPHMWHAAVNSKSCRLTALGEHYRRLVAEDLI